ncbi:MAG TPA: amidase [Acidimicrobiia bacterium]|nr:amidase [Acidimicrobiia bacterium]
MIAGASRAVRTGDGSARESIAAALEMAERAEALNAFTLLEPEAALERAAEIDASVAAGLDPGPLAGIPVALKDLIDHQGRPTTAGSSFYRKTPDESATVVARLEAAGAVIIGRTGLHEFAYGFSSENDWWGPIRNPWDLATSPGGSSGGSAAAVAAGVVPLGIGTVTGGSVRVPAALCGTVGLKVTHGRVPTTGVFPLAASLDTVGPITRSVADAAAAYAAIAGHDGTDPWSIEHPVVLPDRPASLTGLTVGIPTRWLDRPLHPSIAAGYDDAVAALSDAGARLLEIDEPRFDPSRMPGATYAEVALVHRRWFEEDPNRYGPAIRSRLAAALSHTGDEVSAAHAWREMLRRAFVTVFDQVDVLMTPTTAAPYKVIGEDTADTGGEPEPYRPALSWFTPLVNQAGLPALALPLARGEDPPPSLQFIAPWWREHRLLAISWATNMAGITSDARVATAH